MTSKPADCANYRTSTGAKAARGRARSAKNALKHGLSLPIESDPTLSADIEELTRAIAGSDATAGRRERARRIATAQIELRHVRVARRQALSRALSILEPYAPTGAGLAKSGREGPIEFAAGLADLAQQLARMDRYERRALSKRKFAIRAFDAAQRDGM